MAHPSLLPPLRHDKMHDQMGCASLRAVLAQVSSFRPSALTASPAMVGQVDRTRAASCSNDEENGKAHGHKGSGPDVFSPSRVRSSGDFVPLHYARGAPPRVAGAVSQLGAAPIAGFRRLRGQRDLSSFRPYRRSPVVQIVRVGLGRFERLRASRPRRPVDLAQPSFRRPAATGSPP